MLTRQLSAQKLHLISLKWRVLSMHVNTGGNMDRLLCFGFFLTGYRNQLEHQNSIGFIEICDYQTCQKCVSLPTERKEMNVFLTICLKEISLFGNSGYYVLTIFSNTCMNFMGWRRGLGLILKVLLLPLCMHQQCLVIPGL